MSCEDGGWAGWLDGLEGRLGDGGAEWLDRIAYMVIDKACLRPGQVVADLGAGSGLVSLKAARAVASTGRVIAVDSSRECLDALAVRAASLDLGNITTEQGRLESLPVPSASCDAALCRSALTYSTDLDASLAEIRRILVSTGRFSVFEPLPAEMRWEAAEPGVEPDEDFELMERTLKESRASYSLDRAALRGAFSRAGFKAFDSLPMLFTITMEGVSEEEIVGDYLDDLPGELAARSILEGVMGPERMLEVAARFAARASAGKMACRVPSLILWGTVPTS
jgi:ubiquinone/menaquinone biosynthesis C-methylase UbiE